MTSKIEWVRLLGQTLSHGLSGSEADAWLDRLAKAASDIPTGVSWSDISGRHRALCTVQGAILRNLDPKVGWVGTAIDLGNDGALCMEISASNKSSSTDPAASAAYAAVMASIIHSPWTVAEYTIDAVSRKKGEDTNTVRHTLRETVLEALRREVGK